MKVNGKRHLVDAIVPDVGVAQHALVSGVEGEGVVEAEVEAVVDPEVLGDVVCDVERVGVTLLLCVGEVDVVIVGVVDEVDVGVTLVVMVGDSDVDMVGVTDDDLVGDRLGLVVGVIADDGVLEGDGVTVRDGLTAQQASPSKGMNAAAWHRPSSHLQHRRSLHCSSFHPWPSHVAPRSSAVQAAGMQAVRSTLMM